MTQREKRRKELRKNNDVIRRCSKIQTGTGGKTGAPLPYRNVKCFPSFQRCRVRTHGCRKDTHSFCRQTGANTAAPRTHGRERARGERGEREQHTPQGEISRGVSKRCTGESFSRVTGKREQQKAKTYVCMKGEDRHRHRQRERDTHTQGGGPNVTRNSDRERSSVQEMREKEGS